MGICGQWTKGAAVCMWGGQAEVFLNGEGAQWSKISWTTAFMWLLHHATSHICTGSRSYRCCFSEKIRFATPTAFKSATCQTLRRLLVPTSGVLETLEDCFCKSSPCNMECKLRHKRRILMRTRTARLLVSDAVETRQSTNDSSPWDSSERNYRFVEAGKVERVEARVCGRSLGLWVESRRVHECLSVVSVVCCQIEVSATGRSLVQRSPRWLWCVVCGAVRTSVGLLVQRGKKIET